MTDSRIALHTERSRRASSMKIALAIALFFSLAWCLLQWSLVAVEQFAPGSLAREFAIIEARICAAAAGLALLHLAANAIAWSLSARAQRRVASRSRARLRVPG